MKPKLYLETTVPSYLASRPSPILVVAGHQQITKEWWMKQRHAFDIYISQFVLDEVRTGDPEAARERMLAVKDLPVLDITPEVGALASRILATGIIPRKAARDAAHIAIAAVHELDFLVTWNCKHIANAIIARRVASICRQSGFQCPVICTPEELMGE